MVGFTLLSRSYYTICVDEVPAPRSRPTTVRQGNGGLYNLHNKWRFLSFFSFFLAAHLNTKKLKVMAKEQPTYYSDQIKGTSSTYWQLHRW